VTGSRGSQTNDSHLPSTDANRDGNAPKVRVLFSQNLDLNNVAMGMGRMSSSEVSNAVFPSPGYVNATVISAHAKKRSCYLDLPIPVS